MNDSPAHGIEHRLEPSLTKVPSQLQPGLVTTGVLRHAPGPPSPESWLLEFAAAMEREPTVGVGRTLARSLREVLALRRVQLVGMIGSREPISIADVGDAAADTLCHLNLTVACEHVGSLGLSPAREPDIAWLRPILPWIALAVARILAERVPGDPAAPGERGPSERPRASALHLRLTPRQREVLHLVVSGHSNKSIAAQLGCVPGTVELHVSAILARAGAQSRGELSARFWSGEFE